MARKASSGKQKEQLAGELIISQKSFKMYRVGSAFGWATRLHLRGIKRPEILHMKRDLSIRDKANFTRKHNRNIKLTLYVLLSAFTWK